MHEQSIVESLLAIALENAEKANARKIRKIYLVVGELSGVVEEHANYYFNFLTRDTIAEGATIEYNRIPAKVRCRNCGTDFTAENLDFHCPQCGNEKVDIIAGRELYMDSMEIE